MEQPIEYLGVGIAFILAAAIAGLILFLDNALGPKGHRSAVKEEPFECGYPPFASPSGRLSVKFYLIAMLFILFDVEVVWFFPWAVILRELRWAGILEMLAFVAVLVLGFVYAWKKGALEWER